MGETSFSIKYNQVLQRTSRNPNFSPFTFGADLNVDDELFIDTSLLYICDSYSPGEEWAPFGKGIVYKGRYKNEDVAVKWIENDASSRQQQNMFKTEIEILARVNHPNIVRLIGFSVQAALVIIVMEFLGGGTLSDLTEGIRLEPGKASQFALQICKPMIYLHEMGIIHKDLKSENLVFTGDKETLKLIDFGNSEDETVPKNFRQGTPVYMAPELKEKNDYDSKVDVYSFGVVMLEMLTGKDASDLKDLLGGSLEGHGIPSEFLSLVKKCLSVDPDDRPTFPEIEDLLD